jgi:uncharacterized protein (DUF2141 family)
MGAPLRPGRQYATDLGNAELSDPPRFATIVRSANLAAAMAFALFLVAPLSPAIGEGPAGEIPAPPASLSQTGDLTVEINGVRSDSGTIMIGLYDNADGFIAAIKHSTEIGLLNDKSRFAGTALRAAPGTRSAVFMQLPPGPYAIIVFHDENDNGRLDENAWGVPTEGYGFSNDAQGLLGAPSFDAAMITLDGTKRSIAVSLIYPTALSPLELSDLAK